VARWLLKSDPDTYAYADLERDGRTEWDGVHNAAALIHLRKSRPGDGLLFYHSGAERSVVGLAEVASDPHPDPKDSRGSWSMAIRPLRRLRGPVSLTDLRADRALDGFVLFRMSRLSVMPVTDAQWAAVLAHEPGGPSRPATEAARGRARATGSRGHGTSGRRTH
jgi:predicted RNA-binding protein with PUA-like domain